MAFAAAVRASTDSKEPSPMPLDSITAFAKSVKGSLTGLIVANRSHGDADDGTSALYSFDTSHRSSGCCGSIGLCCALALARSACIVRS